MRSTTAKIDVAKATVYIDGRKVAWSSDKPLTLSVGTHALRVTHEEYRDFVRFVDVKFDETTAIDANLTAFPVVTDEMRQKNRPAPVGPVDARPWYREWWAIAGFGVVVVTTAVIVGYAIGGGIDADDEVTVGD